MIVAFLADSDWPLMTSVRQISKSRLSHGEHVGVLWEGIAGTSLLQSHLTNQAESRQEADTKFRRVTKETLMKDY